METEDTERMDWTARPGELLNRLRGPGIQFVKFALIGVLNTAIHYGAFLALLRGARMDALPASAIGYCLGLANSFVFNKFWTFGERSRFHVRQVVRFLVVNLVSLGVNLLVLKVLIGGPGLRPELAQVGAIGCSMVTNFVGNKFWTFGVPAGAEA